MTVETEVEVKVGELGMSNWLSTHLYLHENLWICDIIWVSIRTLKSKPLRQLYSVGACLVLSQDKTKVFSLSNPNHVYAFFHICYSTFTVLRSALLFHVAE